MTDSAIQQARTLIQESQNIVFFGGAGVSTASGIPDFRSATGLYNQRTDSAYSPEYMLRHSFFRDHLEEFYDYLRNNLLYPDVKPNGAHIALAKLEKDGKGRAVITQNIDGLHQKAGSKRVIEIHGNLNDFYCVKCGIDYDLAFIMRKRGVPRCACGSVIRPDVVLYEEPLDQRKMMQSVQAAQAAGVDGVLVASLVVYPAAGLIEDYRGKKLILINREETAYDRMANIVIHDDISRVMPILAE